MFLQRYDKECAEAQRTGTWKDDKSECVAMEEPYGVRLNSTKVQPTGLVRYRDYQALWKMRSDIATPGKWEEVGIFGGGSQNA
jgi:hypothetical protein